MKKKLVSILLVAVMVLSLVACGGNGGTGSKSGEPFILKLCIASEPETIDPSLISSVDGSTYTQHQFEGLMKYVPTSEFADESKQMYNSETAFGQAKDVKISDDQCEYVFTLRDDIFWSDGVEVTANDFVYAWRRIVDPETASDYGYILSGIVLNAEAINAGEMDKEKLERLQIERHE
ncbi:MAG: hypothetical protein IK050_04450, partial [Lachnospiraceae bacterium]|nr:hypothetical protein [Lachnospiraceae bacterium]